MLVRLVSSTSMSTIHETIGGLEDRLWFFLNHLFLNVTTLCKE